MKDVPGPTDPLISRAEELGIPGDYLTRLRRPGEDGLSESEILDALKDTTREQIQVVRNNLKEISHRNKNWDPEQADHFAEKALQTNIGARVEEPKFGDPVDRLVDLLTDIAGDDPEGWQELVDNPYG